jgi:hypothetical protein
MPYPSAGAYPLQVSIELQGMLEAPLLGADAAGWKDQIVDKPLQYEQWLDAEYLSSEATDKIATFKDVVFPLVKSKKKPVLDEMWKKINLVSLNSVSFRPSAGLTLPRTTKRCPV